MPRPHAVPRAALLAACALAALTLAGLAAPLVAPYDPARQFDLVALQKQAIA